MITEIKGTCQYEGCNKPATTIASGRRDYQKAPNEGAYNVGLFCDDHAYNVADHGNPEYHAVCPNCNCRSGVN